MITRSLDKARDAFAKNDVKASMEAHSSAKETHQEKGQYLKNVVYGGLDGIVTTFAIVSGVAGASLSANIVLILGFANLFADGFSMAVGDFLSSKSENEFQKAERVREEWEVDNYPEGEKKEMVELYVSKGMSARDAEKTVELIAKNKKVWVDVMMAEELGIVETEKSPLKGSVVTFFSFVLLGFIPLISYVFSGAFSGLNKFIVASVLAASSLFLLGALKVKFTGRNWILSGLEMMLIGGIAAALAYGIGAFLSGMTAGLL